MASIRDTLANLVEQYKASDTPMANLMRGDTEGAKQAAANALEGMTKDPYGGLNASTTVGAKLAPLLMGIVKNPSMEKAAIEHFGITHSPKETGYILDNGTRLDLSGRHYAGGYMKQGDRYVPEPGQPDYLKNDRAVDHRELGDLDPLGGSWNGLSNFLDQTGAVRYSPETGISLIPTNKPNAKQIETVVEDFRSQRNPLIVDIDHAKEGYNLASKEFAKPNTQEVLDWLEKQYGKFTNK